MVGPEELWRMRKQFSLQVASSCFMTFVFALSSRHPSRFQISRTTGLIAMTELIPGLSILQSMARAGLKDLRQVSLGRSLYMLPLT
jgi:hypothetical protein